MIPTIPNSTAILNIKLVEPSNLKGCAEGKSAKAYFFNLIEFFVYVYEPNPLPKTGFS